MAKAIEYLTLKKDIFAISGKCIAREGDRLNRKILNGLTASGKIFSGTRLLVSETRVYRDLESIINEGIYNNILAPSGAKKAILETLGKVGFHPVIYDELNWTGLFDSYTYHHILVTTMLATRLAIDFFEDKDKVSSVSYSALIHDFGKSRIPLQVLQKADVLTYSESDNIREHPVIGFVLLSYYTGDHRSLACKVALEHHEKSDGSGYPRGIREVNPIVKLITPCDIFDALISHRPYRESPFDQRGALDLLLEEAEARKLDKNVVTLLISYNRQDKPSPDRLVISKEKRGFAPKKNYYGIVKKKKSS